MSLGLYIHVPFCRTRCHFCSFSLQIHRDDRAARYLGALVREIHLHAEQNSTGNRPLETIYFGGGTPTALTANQLISILAQVRDAFGTAADPEITVEAHPDTVSDDGLRQLADAGVNRISFGVQSTNDSELLRIGRRTSGDRTHDAVAMARRAGFANINLDLIYGLQGQTLDGWLATLENARSLEPAHVSCYALTVEEKTKLHIDVRRGDAVEPDAALQNDMEEAAAKQLASAGFTRYEISNYARPGFACRHNLLYWEGQDYLGLGPSAQSYLDGRRFGNLHDTEPYCTTLETGRLPIAGSETLSPEQRLRERLVFGLRLIEGIHPGLLTNTETRRRLIDQGLLEETDGRIKLTEAGRRYADTVAVELI
jgi:oxygen-independent coproporphyrinogen-3 oxidase